MVISLEVPTHVVCIHLNLQLSQRRSTIMMRRPDEEAGITNKGEGERRKTHTHTDFQFTSDQVTASFKSQVLYRVYNLFTYFDQSLIQDLIPFRFNYFKLVKKV